MLAEPVCDDRGWTFAVVQPDNLAQSRGGAKSSRFLGVLATLRDPFVKLGARGQTRFTWFGFL